MEQLTLEALLVTELAPLPPAPPAPQLERVAGRRADSPELQAILDVLDAIPAGEEAQCRDLIIRRCETRWETSPSDPGYDWITKQGLPIFAGAGGRMFVAKCILERERPRTEVAV